MIIFFLVSHGAWKVVGMSLPHYCFDFIPFIFHLSVNASGVSPPNQKLSVHFLCYNTEITVQRVFRLAIGGGFNFFPTALETDFGFSGKRHAGRSPKTQQVSAGFHDTGAFSPPYLLCYLCQLSTAHVSVTRGFSSDS